MPRTLAEIERAEQALAAEKEALLDREATPWPRRLKVYLHSNKDSMWEKGEEVGLDEAGCKLFMYSLYEVEFDLEVSRDGSSRIVAVDKQSLGAQ